MAFHNDCVSRRLCAGAENEDATYGGRPINARLTPLRESTDIEARFNAKLQELDRKLDQTTHDAMQKVAEMQHQLYLKIKSEVIEECSRMGLGKNADASQMNSSQIEATNLAEVDSKIKASRSPWTGPSAPQSNTVVSTECSNNSMDHKVIERLMTLEQLVQENKDTIQANRDTIQANTEGLQSIGTLAASELELIATVEMEHTMSDQMLPTPVKSSLENKYQTQLSLLHEKHHAVKEIHEEKLDKLESAHADLHTKVLEIHELPQANKKQIDTLQGAHEELQGMVKFIHELPAKNKEKIEDLHDKVLQLRTTLQKMSVGDQLSSSYQAVINLEKNSDIKADAVEAEAKKIDGEDFHFELEVSYDRAFERSIWDALYFFALPSISWVHSFFIAFGLICTISCQFTFCYAIIKGGMDNSAFLGDQYPASDDIRAWRIHSGHNIDYIDTLSGESLVERLCNQDGAVSMSQTYQQMLSDLSQYLSDEIGFSLCNSVLYLWALIIVKFLNPVFSGIWCVFLMDHHHTTTIGKATSHKYNHRITHITPFRAVFLIAFKLLEGAVVAVVGITGAMWLSNTKNVQNLILNASALNLVFSVHDLTYAVLLPKKIQRLIETSQPLKMPERSFGGVLHTIVNLLVVQMFAVPFMLTMVWGEHELLLEKVHTLCGGNLQFVYTRHAPTNTIYASSTSGESKIPIYQDHVDAITRLIHTDPSAELSSNTIEITPNHGKVSLVKDLSMQMYVKAYTSYRTTCEDTSGKGFHSRVIKQRTQTAEDSTCVDWKDWCDDNTYTLLRLICPITCGCADPLSGQAYRVESEGCPIETCKETSTYKSVISTRECQDMVAADLKNYEPWIRYINIVQAYSWNQPTVVQNIIKIMQDQGCAGIPTIRNHPEGFDFCDATMQAPTRPGMSSLRMFCPVTCECQNRSPWLSDDCPRACYTNSTTSHADLYLHGYRNSSIG